jgi:hypothetical protein
MLNGDLGLDQITKASSSTRRPAAEERLNRRLVVAFDELALAI